MSGKNVVLISLALNAVLIVALAWLWRHPQGITSQPVPTPMTSSPAGDPVPAAPRPAQQRHAEIPTNLSGPADIDWADIATEDFATYRENLDALGLPERIVAAIIKTEIDFRYDEQLAAHLPSGDFRFWVSGEEQWKSVMPTAEQMRERERILTEKRRLTRELLGAEHAADIADPLMSLGRLQRRMLNFLPPEKQEALAALERQMQADMREKMAEPNADIGARSYFQMKRDLERTAKELLAPDEFEEYLLRTSRTADQMRGELAGFDATPEEFRQIFRIRRPVEDTEVVMNSAEEMTVAREQMDADIHSALGDYRFREYKRSQDPTYQMISRSGQATKASKESIAAVYEVASDMIEESRRIRADPDLSSDEKSAARDKLRRRAEDAVRSHFGYDALDGKHRGRFYWLQQISQDENTRNRPHSD